MSWRRSTGRTRRMLFIRDIARLVQETSAGQARVFHYKTASQLAVLYPRLDADGASLLSLTVLEKAELHRMAGEGAARVP